MLTKSNKEGSATIREEFWESVPSWSWESVQSWESVSGSFSSSLSTTLFRFLLRGGDSHGQMRSSRSESESMEISIGLDVDFPLGFLVFLRIGLGPGFSDLKKKNYQLFISSVTIALWMVLEVDKKSEEQLIKIVRYITLKLQNIYILRIFIHRSLNTELNINLISHFDLSKFGLHIFPPKT